MNEELGSPPARPLVGPEARIISEVLVEYLGSPPASADPDAEEVAFALLAAARRVWERATPGRGELTTSLARESVAGRRPEGEDRVQAAFLQGRLRQTSASQVAPAGFTVQGPVVTQLGGGSGTAAYQVGGPWGRGPEGEGEGGAVGARRPAGPRSPHDPIVAGLLAAERHGLRSGREA